MGLFKSVVRRSVQKGVKKSVPGRLLGGLENMSKSVRMRGLPFRVSEEDIRSFFRSELHNPNPHYNIVEVSIQVGPDGRPNGEALVEFSSEAESERALSLDRQTLGSRYIEIRKAWRNEPEPSRGGGGPPRYSHGPHEPPHGYRDGGYRDGGRDGGYRDGGRPPPFDGGQRDRRSRSRSRPKRERSKERDKRSRSRERVERPREQPIREMERRSASPAPKKKEKKKSNWDAPPDAVAASGEAAANNPQLTYKARRIYVGNLPQEPTITDVMLREFFDQAMQQAGLTSGAGCCVSDVWISSEKNFAFVEVRTVQEANNAMTLDGISFYGSPLRVNRPHDYVPPASDIIAGIPGLAAGTGMPLSPAVNLGTLMQMTKKTRRVHVGNLPVGLGLTPAVLKQFMSQLMQQLHLTVKAGDPVVDSFVSSDGKFGFVEMRTIAEANNALSMSGVEFMGRPIRVGRPADYTPPTPEMILQCEGTGILGTPGDYGVTEFAIPGLPPGPDLSEATTVVALKNMMSTAELESDRECADIADDTWAKCEEDFGRVSRLVIARPGRSGLPEGTEGKVFVQFEQVEDAKKAAVGLNRVKFDDRVVETAFLSEADMDRLAAVYPEQNR